MWKRLTIIMMACAVAFSFSAVGVADAAKYKSPKKSYSPSNSSTQTPNSGVNKNDPAASKQTTNGATNPTTATKPGFFSGGGFMKGMLIGGLAGMLFGGLFGNMGMLGNILGLLVNIMAIFALIAIVVKLVQYFRNKRNLNNQPKQY